MHQAVGGLYGCLLKHHHTKLILSQGFTYFVLILSKTLRPLPSYVIDSLHTWREVKTDLGKVIGSRSWMAVQPLCAAGG